METDMTITHSEIMFAVFDGEKEITESMYEEVENFAAYIKQREGNNK